MRWTNYGFAGAFFAARILLYTAGLAHMAAHRGALRELQRAHPPLVAIFLLLAGACAGGSPTPAQ